MLIINKTAWLPKTKDSCQRTKGSPMLSWAERGTETDGVYRLVTFQCYQGSVRSLL